MSHIKKYLEDAISHRQKKDSLFQRRRALARLACNPTLQGVSKDLMQTTTRKIPETCYKLDEKRFCQLMLNTGFYGRLNTVEGIDDRIAVINEMIDEALQLQQEREAVQLYFSADPVLKVRGDRDSGMSLALFNIAHCRAYDDNDGCKLDLTSVSTLNTLLNATLYLRTNSEVPSTQVAQDNLAKLWFYLAMWHHKPERDITEKMMCQAIAELDMCWGKDWISAPKDFGPTNDVGSELWGEEGTPEYWDGDKFMTPHAACHAKALIHSQAQDAGEFSRDAMCDARNIAARFNINLATAVS